MRESARIEPMYNDLLTELFIQYIVAQSAGAVEYTDCFSAEGKDPPLQRVSWI